MKITILGASGHGKVVADIARLNGYDEITFLGDDVRVTKCGGYPVTGRCEEALLHDNDIFVAIGNPTLRKKYMELFSDKSIKTLIHPDAVIAEDAEIGIGTVVMAGVVINPGTRIARGCIINTCSSVDHDCILEDYVHISVGAHLSGTVEVGANTWIGAGATVSNDVRICSGCLIGAGTVVIRDIEVPGTYIGVPAERLEKME